MVRYIHRERHAEPEPFPKFFEFPVDEMRCAPVLPHGILGRIPDDRKKVGAVIVAIPVQDLLHGLLPFNGQTPAGLPPAVGQHAALQISLFQVGDVDERHAPGIKAQHEHVPGVFHARGKTQVQVTYHADRFQWNSTFYGLVYSGVDMLERAALYRQFPVHRTVVDGTQVPHVIGGAVRTYPLVLQPCLVFQHEGGADILQRDVAVPAPKAREAVQYGGVPLGGALLADTLQFLHEPLSEGHEIMAVLRGRVVKKFDNPAGGIGTAGTFQSGNDTFQTADVFFHPLL